MEIINCFYQCSVGKHGKLKNISWHSCHSLGFEISTETLGSHPYSSRPLWWPDLLLCLRLQVLYKRLFQLSFVKLRKFLQIFNFNSCLVFFFTVLCPDSLRLLLGSLVALPKMSLFPSSRLYFPHSPHAHLRFCKGNEQLEAYTLISCFFSSQSDLIRH